MDDASKADVAAAVPEKDDDEPAPAVVEMPVLASNTSNRVSTSERS
jgi:hypothetical protein